MKIQHELIMPNKDLPFKMFIFEGKDGNYIREKHWHRIHWDFAVFQGTLEFYLNDRQYLLECGDFIIVNSNEVHSIHAPKPNMTVVLQMSLDMFEKYYTGINSFVLYTNHSTGWATNGDNLWDVYGICRQEMWIWSKNTKFVYDMLYLMVTRYRKINVHPDILQQHKQLIKLSAITDYMKETLQRGNYPLQN